MSTNPRICIIGDILVDVSYNFGSETKLRLGGIVHSARALWALNIPYDVGFFAPNYLDKQIERYLAHHGCEKIIKLGNISGSPNVMLVGESKEIGDQGYEYLLRDDLELEYDNENINKIVKGYYQDHLVISGNYNLAFIANQLERKIHVDVANNVLDLELFKSLSRKIDTLFLSTSSELFKKNFETNFLEFAFKFKDFASELVVKENRGGSRSYNFDVNCIASIHAQPRKITHSVGVGDAFDATYIAGLFSTQIEKGVISSWVASEYAATSFPDDFKKGVCRVMKSSITDLVKMPGVSLPWESRSTIGIYIAGPDFSFIDTRHIDTIVSALEYHNFHPRRPIKEIGQMEEGAGKARRLELVSRDLHLLSECKMLVAVLLYDDPGTLIEIGYAKAQGMPTIVYDPYHSARNCMLTEMPDFLSADLEEIITEIFIGASKLVKYGE